MAVKATDGRTEINRAIKADLYSELRKALTQPKTKSSTKSWMQEYIDGMLKVAKQNPNSPIGQLIARQLMSDGIIEKLDAETDKYLARDIDFLEYRLLKTLYDEQQRVFMNEYDKHIIAICSRRVGKSELAARLLIKDAIRPNHHALYVSLKFENAIKQCFNTTLDIINTLGIPIISSSKNEGTITFSNGSDITFKGNANKAEADKLLGYKYSEIVIDECQTQVGLKYLLETVLSPCMTDYEDSQMVLLGTPPRIPKTYVEDIWYNFKGWKKYSWDMTKNPFLKNVEKYIEEKCEEKGITKDAPFIQREYFGLWYFDKESQVFKDYKTYKEIPDTFYPTDVAIGLDYGGTDYNAIIPLVYNRQTKAAYVLTERKFNKASESERVNTCREVYNIALEFTLKRNPNFEKNKCCFYADSSNLPLIYELSNTYNIPIYNCYKHDKMFAIQQLSDWCRTGRIQIPEKQALEDEFERTVYKRDEQDNILPEIDDDLFHPDAVDALLYASRQYAYDCGEDSGNESKNKKEAEQQESRNATLPEWMRGDSNDY